MVKPIVIIGAGIGGLSAAIRLAVAGRRVIMYEQNPTVGGKMSQVQMDGFRWDTGPSVVTMRHVFEDLFQAAGRRLDDYLNLVPVEPMTRYFYSDGVVFDVSSVLTKTLQQIEALDERDVEGYLRYLAYAARLHRITGDVFIYDQPPRLSSFTKVAVPDMIHVDAWRTMDQAIRSYVKSPHLRQLLGRFATYVGANPFRAPATLNVIAHVELNEGVWYPKGGVYSIATAMEKLAVELGVQIQTGCAIQEIIIQEQRAVGVRLVDGTVQEASAVVANVDVSTVYSRLIPATIDAGYRSRLKHIEPSCSGFIILAGVKGDHPRLAHHNIFFSRDYRREFDDIFKQQLPPQEPTIYVAITSKTDAADAPDGHENWFILVNAPAISPAYDWEHNKATYRDRVLDQLASYGVDIRDAIQVEQIMTPLDIQRQSGAWRGALYGSSSNNPFAAFLRPHNRSSDFGALYFVGGTTHPGGGVPMVTLSGKVAAQMVLADGV